MSSFALYRLPHQQQVTLVEQTADRPVEWTSCTALSGQQGFVVAPFAADSRCPIVLIRPDRLFTMSQEEVGLLRANPEFAPSKLPVCSVQTAGLLRPNCQFSGSPDERSSYAADFSRFHARLQAGDFRKIVLSRCSVVPHKGKDNPVDLFCRACQRYPRLFVALVYTPQSGMWLTATPEILLEGVGDEWRTIALAGTMQLEGDDLLGEGEHVTWSTKNIQEQRYVATYLTDCLERYAVDIREEGPRTVRAANLVHLRSDFTFHIYNKVRVGELLQALHPTPAVCGLPKEQAYRFILENEHAPRLYYSGFMGPLNLSPAASSPAATHLYVSLRCMQITDQTYRLYAGGGLLKDSTEEQEWQETEAKLQTMRMLNIKYN